MGCSTNVGDDKAPEILHAVRALVPVDAAPSAPLGRLSASSHRADPAQGHTHAVPHFYGQALPQAFAAKRRADRLRTR